MVCVVGHVEHKGGGDIPECLEDGPLCVGGVGGGADSGAHAAGGLSAAPAVTATRARIVVVDEFACSGVGRQNRRVEGG